MQIIHANHVGLGCTEKAIKMYLAQVRVGYVARVARGRHPIRDLIIL